MITYSQWQLMAKFTVSPEKFQECCNIDVSEFLEYDKNRGLDYLNWAVARKLLVEHFPTFIPVVLVNDNFLPYVDVTPFDDGQEIIPRGSFVNVCLFDASNNTVSLVLNHPVMANNKMNSAVEIPTSRQIHDAIQRAITKVIALVTGIGFGQYMRNDDLIGGSGTATDDEEEGALGDDIDYDSEDEEPLPDDEIPIDDDDDDYYDGDEEDYEPEPAPRQQQQRRTPGRGSMPFRTGR